MIIQNTENIETVEHLSPKGTFAALRKNLTVALDSPRDEGPWAGGHPFDVEHVVIPAGKPNFPYHGVDPTTLRRCRLLFLLVRRKDCSRVWPMVHPLRLVLSRRVNF